METHDSCRVNEDLRLHDDESYLAKRKQNNKSFTILTNAKRKLKMLTNKNKKKKIMNKIRPIGWCFLVDHKVI